MSSGFNSVEKASERIVLLTGATSGIGLSTARRLAKASARIALMARSEGRLQQLAVELTETGASVPLVLVGDVRNEGNCDRAINGCIEHFGGIDVLINSAGVGFPSDLSTVPTDDYLKMMETNVNGVFYLTRAALPRMRAQKRGHIVMVSSGAGIQANAVAPLYCASKFALEGYTDGLRKQVDLWRHEGTNIRVSNVKPGMVDSGYWGERTVDRSKFMTCDEMADVLSWVIETPETVNVTEIRVESRR